MEGLLNGLREKSESLSPLSSECCIYRVPRRLRKFKDEACFKPQVVSIGPLHHGNESLQVMEQHKRSYLIYFLRRTHVSLEDFVNLLKEKEARLRNSYEEDIELCSDKFLEIIMVDAAFIIELMIRYYILPSTHEKDRIFYKPWLIREIMDDILLLENQLPFFILESLFVKAKISFLPQQDERLSLIWLTHHLFKTKAYLGEIEQHWDYLCSSKIEHFLHFIRICHVHKKLPPKRELKTLTVPSATQLHQVGVKFKVGSNKNLFCIEFKNGILKIPKFRLYGITEIFFRNLVAFEQCHLRDNYIHDYFFVIDQLIDTPKDVELFVQHGIIESRLPDSQGVVTLIKNLTLGSFMEPDNFYFANLCDDLNAYYSVRWRKWKATLKQDYLSTPWVVIPIIICVIGLILNFIQTVCSFISAIK